MTAEGVYRRALSLDDANPEAQEALRKITETIQVGGPQRASTFQRVCRRAHLIAKSSRLVLSILKEADVLSHGLNDSVAVRLEKTLRI